MLHDSLVCCLSLYFLGDTSPTLHESDHMPRGQVRVSESGRALDYANKDMRIID